MKHRLCQEFSFGLKRSYIVVCTPRQKENGHPSFVTLSEFSSLVDVMWPDYYAMWQCSIRCNLMRTRTNGHVSSKILTVKSSLAVFTSIHGNQHGPLYTFMLLCHFVDFASTVDSSANVAIKGRRYF